MNNKQLLKALKENNQNITNICATETRIGNKIIHNIMIPIGDKEFDVYSKTFEITNEVKTNNDAFQDMYHEILNSASIVKDTVDKLTVFLKKKGISTQTIYAKQ